MRITPRTKIQGAHQQGVSVNAGGRLPSKKPIYSYKRLYLFLAIAIPLLATDWIPVNSYLGVLKAQLIQSVSALAYLPTGFQIVAISSFLLCCYFIATIGKPYLRFAYNCFLKPFMKKKPSGIDSEDHQKRLEEFYEGQADIYDVTRKRFVIFNL